MQSTSQSSKPVVRSRSPASTTTVTRTHKGNVVDEQVADSGVKMKPAPGCGSVTVGGGVTQNMGDFNSVKVYVEATLPADEPGFTGLDKAYTRLSDWIEAKVQNEVNLAVGSQSDN